MDDIAISNCEIIGYEGVLRLTQGSNIAVPGRRRVARHAHNETAGSSRAHRSAWSYYV